METFEMVQEQVAATVGVIAELERSAIGTLLEVGDSIFDLRGAISAAAAKQQEFARTGGINDNKAALRSLRQLLWQVRMLANAASNVRDVAAGIAEDYAASGEAGKAVQA